MQLLEWHFVCHQLPEQYTIGEQVTPLGVWFFLDHLAREGRVTVLVEITISIIYFRGHPCKGASHSGFSLVVQHAGSAKVTNLGHHQFAS